MKFSLPKLSAGLCLAMLAACLLALHQSGLRFHSWSLDDGLLGILLTAFLCIPLLLIAAKMKIRR